MAPDFVSYLRTLPYSVVTKTFSNIYRLELCYADNNAFTGKTPQEAYVHGIKFKNQDDCTVQKKSFSWSLVTRLLSPEILYQLLYSSKDNLHRFVLRHVKECNGWHKRGSSKQEITSGVGGMREGHRGGSVSSGASTLWEGAAA